MTAPAPNRSARLYPIKQIVIGRPLYFVYDAQFYFYFLLGGGGIRMRMR